MLERTFERARTLQSRGRGGSPDGKTSPLSASRKVARALSYAVCQGAKRVCAAFPCVLGDRGKRQKAETAGRRCRRWLVTRFHHAFRAKAARRFRARDISTMYTYSCLLKACVRNDDGSSVRNIERSLDKARPSYTTSYASIGAGPAIERKKKRESDVRFDIPSRCRLIARHALYARHPHFLSAI